MLCGFSSSPCHSFKKFSSLVIIILALLSSHVSYSQGGTGSITAKVLDTSTRRAIQDAVGTLFYRDALVAEVVSSREGELVFDGLRPGLYTLKIEHPDYLIAVEPSVRVVADKAATLRASLRLNKPSLEETLVIGRAVNADPSSAASTTFLNREALRSATGSGSDVLRALDGLPGLFSSGDFASFSVRGNGPRDNLILVDGVPYDNVVHFDQSLGEQEDIAGGGRYSVFAPNLVAGAEFFPGGWSSAYGGRSGSLLKLDIADGNTMTPSYSLRLDLAGFEVGYDGPSRVHDNTAVLFSARRLDFGKLFETIDELDIGQPILTDVIVKTTTEINSRNTLSFLVIYAPEEYDRNIDNVLASPDFDDVAIVDSKTDNSLLTANWTRQFGESGEMTHRLYYRYAKEEASQGEAFPDLVEPGTPANVIPIRPGIISIEENEDEFGLRSDVSFNNDLGKLSLGLELTQVDLLYRTELREDWIRYVFDQNDFRSTPEQKFVVWTPESVNSTLDGVERSYATYIDQIFDLGDWEFRTGLRYDYADFSEESLISPRLGAQWFGNKHFRLSANAGVYYQTPRFLDRASDPSGAELESEELMRLSVGGEYIFSSELDLLIEPYVQRLDNLVVQTDGVNRTYTNDGEGTSVGMDIVLNKQFTDGWSANLTYSYNRATLNDGDGSPDYDADFNRPHAFSAGGVWEISDRWKISARWKWASGKPRDEFIVHENVLGDGELLRFSKEIISTNTERYGNFHSLNVRADFRNTLGSFDLIAFIDVINIYGAENPSSSEFNERTGEDAVEDGSAIPLLGLRMEW